MHGFLGLSIGLLPDIPAVEFVLGNEEILEMYLHKNDTKYAWCVYVLKKQ